MARQQEGGTIERKAPRDGVSLGAPCSGAIEPAYYFGGLR